MAKIDSYVLADAPLSGSDKLIGTDTANGNATKNFSISTLIQFVETTNTFVPYTGASSNVNLNAKELNNVNIIRCNYIQSDALIYGQNLNLDGKISLNGNYGTSGQVLTSQGSSLDPIWTNASAGPQGIQGPVGPAGPAGPVGPAGLNWQGAWVSGSSYVVDDAVGYGGASWFCINNTSGTITPNLDTANWALLAAQGATGPQGPAGAQGPTGPQGPQGATGTNTLQQVLNNSTSLTNGRNFQGTGAGAGNFGFNVNAFGTNSATNNSGTHVNAFGVDAGDSNTGGDVNAFGNQSAQNNAGNHVNAIGKSAGNGNTYSYVTLLGENATASANNQLVFSNSGGFNAQISNTNLTADRLYELPNNSGTIALTTDIVLPYLVFSGLLSISGSTVTVTTLQNTLGVTFTWSNPANGIVRGVSSGSPFDLTKTWVSTGCYNNGGLPYFVTSVASSTFPWITFSFFLHDGTITGTPNVTNFPIEIRVYP
jgi:hypothetical protein